MHLKVAGTLRQLGQRLGQVMAVSITRQVVEHHRPAMSGTQRLTQHSPERRQAAAAGQQVEWLLLPLPVIVQRTAAQLADAQAVTDLPLAQPVGEGSGTMAGNMQFQKV